MKRLIVPVIVLAGLVTALAAAPAMAELQLRVAFTEKQLRAKGLSRSFDTCRTEYAIRTLGRLLFIETVKSNCRTFPLDDVRGTDGSASAIVFDGPKSVQRKTCTYSARSHVEACSDHSKVRLPGGPGRDYKAQVLAQGRYQLGRKGLVASRKLTREHTDSQGAGMHTETNMKIAITIDGRNCRITEFASSSTGKETSPGRGRALKAAPLRESRKLVKPESCKVISR